MEVFLRLFWISLFPGSADPYLEVLLIGAPYEIFSCDQQFPSRRPHVEAEVLLVCTLLPCKGLDPRAGPSLRGGFGKSRFAQVVECGNPGGEWE